MLMRLFTMPKYSTEMKKKSKTLMNSKEIPKKHSLERSFVDKQNPFAIEDTLGIFGANTGLFRHIPPIRSL